jgi:hypothetical protein
VGARRKYSEAVVEGVKVGQSALDILAGVEAVEIASIEAPEN